MASGASLGGVFLRADDPEALLAWYERHLGLVQEGGAWVLPAPARPSPVILAVFARDDPYFPAAQPVMLNLRVDDLDATLDRLAADGVAVDERRDSYDFGRFGWCTDPEGNRIELWEPAPAG